MNIHLTMGILTMAQIFPIHSTKILDWTISSKSEKHSSCFWWISKRHKSHRFWMFCETVPSIPSDYQSYVVPLGSMVLDPVGTHGAKKHRGLSWQCDTVREGYPMVSKHHMGSAQKISECTSPYLGLWIPLCKWGMSLSFQGSQALEMASWFLGIPPAFSSFWTP